MYRYKLNIISSLIVIFFLNIETNGQVPTKDTSFKLSYKVLGDWTNDSQFLHLHDSETIFLEYNHSCSIELPIKILSPQSFEVIWKPILDCVFDLGIPEELFHNDFPMYGKPFVKMTLRKNTLVTKHDSTKGISHLSRFFTESYIKTK